jgi:hypothetical protein
MSAWMTSEKHINTLATFAYVEGLTLDPTSVASLLTLHNVLSLMARYGNSYREMCEGWKDYAYKPVSLAKLGPAFIAKQAHCFDYQACEHDGWAGSEGKRMIDAIVERCLQQGAVEDGPKYDAAPWGID